MADTTTPPEMPKHLFIHQQQQQPATPSSSTQQQAPATATAAKDDSVPAGMTKLPNGVILDKDGKPYDLLSTPHTPYPPY